MYENEMRIKEEEYLYSLTKKDELYLNTVTEFEEKLSELRIWNLQSVRREVHERQGAESCSWLEFDASMDDRWYEQGHNWTSSCNMEDAG